MAIHIKPEVCTIRRFAVGDKYEDKRSPIFSCTAHFISDSEVYICNAIGSFSRQILVEMCIELELLGCTLLRYERRKKLKEASIARIVATRKHGAKR